ncbi:hypothetical protein MNV49_000774 [Pseudohyphozyma bogoriensis]|nr:hypothetical protein MNV49_000774 [Pseudohyphozyma bogoriensis]
MASPRPSSPAPSPEAALLRARYQKELEGVAKGTSEIYKAPGTAAWSGGWATGSTSGKMADGQDFLRTLAKEVEKSKAGAGAGAAGDKTGKK